MVACIYSNTRGFVFLVISLFFNLKSKNRLVNTDLEFEYQQATIDDNVLNRMFYMGNDEDRRVNANFQSNCLNISIQIIFCFLRLKSMNCLVNEGPFFLLKPGIQKFWSIPNEILIHSQTNNYIIVLPLCKSLSPIYYAIWLNR